MTSAVTTTTPIASTADACHVVDGSQMSVPKINQQDNKNIVADEVVIPAAAVATPVVGTASTACGGDGTSSQGSKAVSSHMSPDGGVNKRTPSATELRELLSSLGALVQMDTVNEIGPEKRLELDLRPRHGTSAESLTQVPGAVEKMLARMKMLDDPKLDRQQHPVAGLEALSVCATDAMVLFARRRFVVTASHKFPLHRYIADLLKAIRAAGFDVEWASFMRKNDVSPWAAKDLQMAKEFSVLKLYFPKGRSHMFGAVDGDHYYFFVADNIDRALPHGTRTVEDDVQFNMKLYDVEYQGDEQCFQRLGISEKAITARATLQTGAVGVVGSAAFAPTPHDGPSHVGTPREGSGSPVAPTSPESLMPPATPMSAEPSSLAGSRRALPRTPSQGSVGVSQQYEIAVQGCRFYSNEWYEHLRIAHRVDGDAHTAVATYETTVDEHETARDAMVDLVKTLRPGRFTIIALVDPVSRMAALLRRRQDIGVEPRLYEGYALQTRTLNTFQAGYQVVKSTFVRCDLDTRVHPPLPAV